MLNYFRNGLHVLVTVLTIVLFIVAWKKVFTHKDILREVVTTPEVKTIYVDKPVITEKIVKQLFTDPAVQKALDAQLAHVKELNAQVVSLTATIAELKSHGGTDDGGSVHVTPPDGGTPLTLTYHDWHLDFNFDGTKVNYDLNQKFRVLTTTGRHANGEKFTLVTLAEVKPDGSLVPATKVETTGVFIDETKPHWHVSPTLQAGVLFSPDSRGGIVGLQWLKRGRTSAAEDSSFSVLTPTFFFTQSIRELGLLPVSANVGAVKYVPFKDVWVSPYLGVDAQQRTLSRFGLALTASF